MGTSVVGLWGQAVQLLRDATKDAASCADLSLFFRVKPVHDKLNSLPPPPKATWRKLVQQEVPLKIATAFNTAAQHSWKSPGTNAALQLLELLLASAASAGLCKDRAAVGSVGSSMQHQLQQSRLLQQLTAAMVAIAAEWRSEAAALESLSGDQLCSDVNHFLLADMAQSAFVLVGRVYPHLREVWGTPGEALAASSSSWLSDPSNHAEAAMQLCTATLQHVSSVLTHVLPVLQERLPQQADALLRDQLERAAATLNNGDCAVDALYHSQPHEQQQQRRLQQLLLSPHCLPCVAALLVVTTTWVSRDATLQLASRSQGPEGRGGVSCNSSSSVGSSSSNSNASRQRGSRQRPVTAAAPANDSSSTAAGRGDSGSVDRSDILTALQLELVSLLGLTPQLTSRLQQLPSTPTMEKIRRLTVAVLSTSRCRDAALMVASGAPFELGQQAQRWQFEQRLWLLLPSVLLPCANHILSFLQPADDLMETVMVLLEHSTKALTVSNAFHAWLWLCGGSRGDFTPPHPGKMEELLDGVLQLADQLLLQKPPAALQIPAAGAVAVPAGSGGSQGVIGSQAAPGTKSSRSSRASQGFMPPAWADGTAAVVQLLSVFVSNSSAFLLSDGTTASPPHQPSSDSAGTTASEPEAAMAAPPYPLPVAKRFVAVCTALDAGMRAVTIGVQRGVPLRDEHYHSVMMQALSALDDAGRACPFALHLGLCGPELFVQEQRQLYSVLRCVLKLGQQQCWGPQADNDCCWVVALAAVTLLQRAPAAGAEQPAEEWLPSLVVLGHCCLAWALQLQQQAPAVLLQGPGAAVQQQGGVPRQHSAAHACIPGWYEGESSADTALICRLELVVATTRFCVDGTVSPAAHTALTAAAGGDLGQLRQQLKALSAAQQAMREGLSDVNLTALIERLQATGVMLCSIPVPHFCNNPACGNISGPTDVQLVSGRSCICAGCRTARYCGRGCQRQAWPQHKLVCKAMAAAAASTCQM